MNSGWTAFAWVSVLGLVIISFGLGATMADPHAIMGITLELKKFDWNAVSALATTAATVAALYTSHVALTAPERQREEERSEATIEVLCASQEAVRLFQRAKAENKFAKQAEFSKCALLATHQRDALNRLINRTVLTDGAIITGVAAMSLMDAIVNQENIRRELFSKPNFAVRMSDWITSACAVEAIVLDRGQRTASYASRKRWPHWEERFKRISEEGLLAQESRLENITADM